MMRVERADEDIKAECTRCSTTISLDDELEELKVQNEKLVKDNNVLNKTLKEIEEIAERDCFVICNSYDFKECCDKGCINSKILKKIKEVENERQI